MKFMEYTAIFEIDGAVSKGFACKTAERYTEIVSIPAESQEDGLVKAIEKARYYSKESLSNPETGLTVVKLLSLEGITGLAEKIRSLPEDFLKKFPKVEFEGDYAVVKCSTDDHFILHALGYP